MLLCQMRQFFLPNVVVSDGGDAKQHVVVTTKQNMTATNEAIGDENSVALVQSFGEQNGALS